MKTRYNFGRALLLAVIVLLAGHSAVYAQSADQVARRLQTKYNSIKALRAEFTQTMSSSYGNGQESLTGTLVLQGDKYRVETKGQTLVNNGAVTWVYNAAENQVLINKATEDETTFSISDFLLNFNQHYQAIESKSVRLNGQKHLMLRLKPRRSDSFFREVTLWLRDSDTVITRLQVLDMNETQMVFNLKNIELNPRLNGNTFTFQPPKNAQVIDLRS